AAGRRDRRLQRPDGVGPGAVLADGGGREDWHDRHGQGAARRTIGGVQAADRLLVTYPRATMTVRPKADATTTDVARHFSAATVVATVYGSAVPDKNAYSVIKQPPNTLSPAEIRS